MEITNNINFIFTKDDFIKINNSIDEMENINLHKIINEEWYKKYIENNKHFSFKNINKELYQKIRNLINNDNILFKIERHFIKQQSLVRKNNKVIRLQNEKIKNYNMQMKLIKQSEKLFNIKQPFYGKGYIGKWFFHIQFVIYNVFYFLINNYNNNNIDEDFKYYNIFNKYNVIQINYNLKKEFIDNYMNKITKNNEKILYIYDYFNIEYYSTDIDMINIFDILNDNEMKDLIDHKKKKIIYGYFNIYLYQNNYRYIFIDFCDKKTYFYFYNTFLDLLVENIAIGIFDIDNTLPHIGWSRHIQKFID